MKISQLYEGDDQDRKIEDVQKIMAFRQILFDYAVRSGSNEAKTLASMVAFALFGAAHKYKACCILFFVENYFYDRPNPKTHHPIDQRIVCSKCEKEVVEFLVDSNLR